MSGEPVEYTVVIDGDAYDHESFITMVEEHGGEIIEQETAEESDWEKFTDGAGPELL